MMRLLLLPAFLWAGAALGQDFSTTVDRVDGAVGRVILDGVSGSGFVVARDGDDMLLVTNYHVIESGGDMAVGFLHQGDVALFAAGVEAASPGLDLALLRLRQVRGPAHTPDPLPIADRSIRKAEPVAAIGFPGVSDTHVTDADVPGLFENTFSAGAVSKVFEGNWEPGAEEIELVQHSAAINPGNSGGPLIDLCGALVGVNTQRAVDDGSGPPAGTFWASSAKTIARFLDAERVAYTSVAAPCGNAAAPPSGAGAEAAASPPPPGRSGRIPGWMIAVVALVAGGGLLAAAAFALRSLARPGPDDRLKEAVAVALAPRWTEPSVPPDRGLELLVSGQNGTSSHRVAAPRMLSGFTIGRAPQADVRLDDRGVSREHARIRLHDRRLTITDLGSTNGTVVDGRRLAARQSAQINSSSVIVIGDLSLRVRRQTTPPPE